MNLFYGIGIGIGAASVPRLLLGIDLSVLLSVANIAALIWHARIVSREAGVVPEGVTNPMNLMNP